MQPPEPIWHEECLEHEGFVRRLAQSLVHDGHLAEDLVQDTMIAAMRRPAWTHSSKAWLATITRRLAANVFRERDRRRYREAQVARTEALDDELPGQTALALAQLGDAFQTLQEKYRSPLIQRYFEGCSSFEIARRLDLPAATVRTRIRRGLELLREHLDRESNGRRAAWLAPLSRWLEPGIPLFGLWPLARLALGGVLLASGLVAWQWSARSGGAAGGVSPITAVQDAQARVARETSDAPRVAVAETTRPAGFELRLLSTEANAPLAGVTVRLERAGPYDWALHFLEFETGDEGYVRVEQLSAGDWTVRPALGSARELTKIAGEPLQLELRVEPGRRVAGQAFLAGGEPAAGMRVHASYPDAVNVARVAGRTDGAGRFHLDGVDRRSWIGVRGRDAGDSAMHYLGSPIHESKEVAQLVLEMGASQTPLHGVIVDPSGRPIDRAHVRVGEAPSIAMRVVGNELIVAGASHRTRTGEDGFFAIRGTNPGISGHEIWVYCPGYGPLRVPRSGEKQTITLTQAVSVTGVVYGHDGQPLAGAEVRAWPLTLPFSQSMITDEEGRYAFNAMPAGVLRVEVRSTHGSAALEWTAAPGDQKVWDAYIEERQPIRGRVSDAAGQPIAAADVFLTPMRRLSLFHTQLASEGETLRKTQTAADGTFAFYGCGREGQLVSLTSPGSSAPYPWCTARNVFPDGPPLHLQVRPSIEPSAFLAGRLLAADGAPLRTAELILDADRVDRPARLRARVDASTGEFRLGPLPPGRYHLDTWTPEVALSAIGSFQLAAGEQRELGDVRLEPGGSLQFTFDMPPTSGCTIRIRGAHGLHLLGRQSSPLSPIVFSESGARVDNLPAGAYVANVSLEGHATFSRRLEIHSDEVSTLAVELPVGAPITVEIERPRSVSAIQMQTLVQLSIRSVQGAEVYSGQQVWRGGRELLTHTAWLAPGEYICTVSTPQGFSGETSLVVTESRGRARLRLQR
jgi:RNA polymerase sigma factor (sigma-70 family)